MSNQWLIYGVTGYTGQLIIEEAKKQGLSLTMAGRSESKLAAMKEQYGYDYLCFDLDSRQEIAEILKDYKVLLNCAGPFSKTAKVMISACLHSNTHYLDITGEVAVFEHARMLHKTATQKNVLLCPGVGFDVVPTDCLAKGVHERLPDAETLWLGFDSQSRMSPGTAKTAVEGLASGGKVCRGGRVVDVPLAYKVRNIDFGNGTKSAATIPWGDVSTATVGTDIPNVEVYVPVPEKKIKSLRRMEKFRWFFKFNWVIKMMQNRIDKKVVGPNEERRAKNATYVWAEGINKAGDVVTGRIKTLNGYDVTKDAAIAISQYLLHNEVAPGFITPGTLMGSDFVEKLPGSEKIIWEDTRSESTDALE